MDNISRANKRLKVAWEKHKRDHDRDYEAQIKKLNDEEMALFERSNKLEKKKIEIAKANGKEDASPDDLLQINAGGTTMAVKRGTLCQVKGTRIEALFSGRWDKKLQRDSSGRIFLDVNPVCFQAIIDYLDEMMISSEHNQPALPTAEDGEHKHILKHQLELFGLHMLHISVDSHIIEDETHVIQLHNWLNQGGRSDGGFHLLYRSTRDGTRNEDFYSKCGNKGCTVTIIETTDGHVIGGYSDVPWAKAGSFFKRSDKAFLFCLSGESPFKMELKGSHNNKAVYHSFTEGPSFGSYQELHTQGSTINWCKGSYQDNAYESNPSWPLEKGRCRYKIKKMEVFQVVATKQVQVGAFTKAVNSAINDNWETLRIAKGELSTLEESFKDEEMFIPSFAIGQPQDVVQLNVRGTPMMTRLQTLQLCEESVLASKFSGVDNDMPASSATLSIGEWKHEAVVAWLNKVEGVTDEVVKEFEENQVTGRELLTLGVDGLKDFGVTRKGTIYLLLDEIKKLEKASSNSSATLIEHSPYIFGKILDHLRLEDSFMKGLVTNKHELPIVRDAEKERYEKVLKHLFPGESSKIFENV